MNLIKSIPAAWQDAVTGLASEPKIAELEKFLCAEVAEHAVFPPPQSWFFALETLPPDDVKVVILGQDPYHGAGEAHGLAFSVPKGVKTPPSLRNIWQELAQDQGITAPPHGNLAGWAAQGVLLLNTAFSVRADCAGSHGKQGWDLISNALIEYLSRTQSNIVFLLWGAHAQKRAKLIDAHRHCIMQSAHPSPLSAYRGFFGCAHFSQANAYLQLHQKTPIDWANA
ncbi:uracil-DNA glycosylase [Chitinibacter bivalviorum]|uniref:Uracil-DNA glycosylase n=1 Tax=Chitinibacter bivalviorum TaxID=2739434 RepID=A0A7H9BJ05_9NEIS|nr:uracil-DNA glycosylase [Chitinibacter bivalviorum]QLG87544.1 uracil-DNA glycosylase [Chitinibacter bivalviorum]